MNEIGLGMGVGIETASTCPEAPQRQGHLECLRVLCASHVAGPWHMFTEEGNIEIDFSKLLFT